MCMNKEDFIKLENQLRDNIIKQLKVGGNPEYDKVISNLFPIGKIPSPVKMPAWMFRKYPHHKQLELSDIEKVAMAHVIHFSLPGNLTGYIECSGNIENWCKCTVEEAHEALRRLTKDNLITCHTLEPELCYNHKRNYGYFVNFAYLHELLSLYNMDIWT